jgi:hypothetical protein
MRSVDERQRSVLAPGTHVFCTVGVGRIHANVGSAHSRGRRSEAAHCFRVRSALELSCLIPKAI